MVEERCVVRNGPRLTSSCPLFPSVNTGALAVNPPSIAILSPKEPTPVSPGIDAELHNVSIRTSRLENSESQNSQSCSRSPSLSPSLAPVSLAFCSKSLSQFHK